MAEEFEQIEALGLDEEDGDTMNTSDYAQVVFHDIAESYPVDYNIICKYTVTSLLQASKRDWVGVYKVGWTSSKDHVYYEWAKLPESVSEGKSFGSQITFKANTLPGDDGEFYQFCYVTSMGQVRGASTPFQFKRPSAEQYVEIEDFDDDIMVIKSKTSALEDELGSVRKERETLVKGRERLENERESLLHKLLASEKKISSEKQQREVLLKEIKTREAKVESLQSEARDMGLVNDSLREKINKLSEEKMSLSRKLDEKDSYIRSVQEKVRSLINEKDSLMGKNRMLEEEKDLYKTHFSSSENTLQGHLKEIDDLKKQLGQEEEASADLRGEINTLGQELELTINKLNLQERTVQQDKEQIEILTEQLKCNQEKIEALEQCKLSLGEELETVTLAMTDVSDKWERSKNEAHKYKEQLKLLEHVHENQTVSAGEQLQGLNMRLKRVTEENEALTDESMKLRTDLEEMAKKANKTEDAPLAIMKMAHRQLTTRLNRAEQEKEGLQRTVDELMKKKESWEMSSHEIKRETEDLKERLVMGQDEYRDKSVECQRLRKEVKKLQKKVSQTRSRKSSVSCDSLSDSCTQTRKSTGDKSIETDPKAEAEQMTQTRAREEKENHTQTTDVAEKETETQTKVHGKETETQTSVHEKESETQTSVHEKETETQTSVPDMEQSENDPENLADLTNPELQCQLDDLGKELATRNARKQKYKDMYQKEREKCAYLQRHYHEELEKKDEEMERVKHMLESMQEQVKYLERCLSEKETEDFGVKVKVPQGHGQTEAHTHPYYPPQTLHHNKLPGVSPPVITQPGPSSRMMLTTSAPLKPRANIRPTISQPNPPSKGGKRTPPRIPPRLKKGDVPTRLSPKPLDETPFPVYYDNQPIIPNSSCVPTDTVQTTQSSGPPVFAVPTLNLQELDPLKNPAPKSPATPGVPTYDHPALLPPLQPEVLPTARVAEVLGAVAGHSITESTAEDEETQVMGPGWKCPSSEELAMPEIKVPPQCGGSDPVASSQQTGSVEPEGGSAAAVESGERSGGGVSGGLKEGGQASGGAEGTEEQEEERFFDAQDEKAGVMKQKCPVCEMTFDTSEYPEQYFLEHVEMHFTHTKDCPMCGKRFSSDTDNNIYTKHVTRHFEGSDGVQGDDLEEDGGFTQL